MSYYSQVLALTAVAGLLSLAAYLPLASGALVVCLGSAMGFGAIAASMLTKNQASIVAVLGALIVASIAGAAFMAAVAAAVRRMAGFILSISTLAIAELTRVAIENEPRFGGALGVRAASIHSELLWPVLGLAIAALVVGLFELSPARSALALAADSSVRASALGIDHRTLRFWAMTASGALAGLAGGLYVLNVGIFEPHSLGFQNGIQIAMFAVVGGRRSYRGSLAAAVGLTVIPEILRFTANNRMVLYGVVLIAIMVVRSKSVTYREAVARFLSRQRSGYDHTAGS